MFGSHIRAYGQQLGLLPDLFILGLCILSSFPLTALYVLIPTTPAFRTTRHWFSIIATSTIALLVFDEYSILHLLGSTLATYFVTLWLGDRWWTPYVVFTATLAHLSWIHMGAQFWYIDSPDFVDISAPMMVLVIKLSSYAWSVYDGTRPDQELHSEMRLLQSNKIFLIQVAGFSTRAKLSSAWKISEAAGIFTGIGYAGLTNLVSAMWHGFHAGYYMSFLSATLWIIVGRTTRRYFRPFVTLPESSLRAYKPLYDTIGHYHFVTRHVGVGRYLLRYWLPKFVGADAAASARGEAVVECEETQASRGSMAKVAGVTKPSTKYKKA
ncbi:hypothetical protein BASA81_011168 [Batrachochytrium salamandrivorans]|nr:hypothetical protein BASA81_011168 [Batrachochytrium salamandrivorans]